MKRPGVHHGGIPAVGRCSTCGKVCYPSRKAAKIAGRRLNMGSEPLSAYRCGDYWHLGHLPYEVRRGVIARASMTPAAPRRPRNEP